MVPFQRPRPSHRQAKQWSENARGKDFKSYYYFRRVLWPLYNRMSIPIFDADIFFEESLAQAKKAQNKRELEQLMEVWFKKRRDEMQEHFHHLCVTLNCKEDRVTSRAAWEVVLDICRTGSLDNFIRLVCGDVYGWPEEASQEQAEADFQDSESLTVEELDSEQELDKTGAKDQAPRKDHAPSNEEVSCATSPKASPKRRKRPKTRTARDYRDSTPTAPDPDRGRPSNSHVSPDPSLTQKAEDVAPESDRAGLVEEADIESPSEFGDLAVMELYPDLGSSAEEQWLSSDILPSSREGSLRPSHPPESPSARYSEATPEPTTEAETPDQKAIKAEVESMEGGQRTSTAPPSPAERDSLGSPPHAKDSNTGILDSNQKSSRSSHTDEKPRVNDAHRNSSGASRSPGDDLSHVGPRSNGDNQDSCRDGSNHKPTSVIETLDDEALSANPGAAKRARACSDLGGGGEVGYDADNEQPRRKRRRGSCSSEKHGDHRGNVTI